MTVRLPNFRLNPSCFVALNTVTNVPPVFVSVVVVVRWSRNVGEHQTHQHLEFGLIKTSVAKIPSIFLAS